MKYVKKPIVVEAFQYGKDAHPKWFIDKVCLNEIISHIAPSGMPYVVIKTLEGNMMATPGEMIIKGIQGEIYPCKRDIFDATYDLVKELEGDRK